MDELAIRAALTDSRFGDVRVVSEIDSTNRALLDWAKVGVDEIGQTVHDGSVLIARSQTAGRGRLGRHWIAPPDTALLMSVLVRTDDLVPAHWPLLSFAMGLAVANAVGTSGSWPATHRIALKWPNDVTIDDDTSTSGYRKLAGILAESSLRGPGTACVVVGVGVNLVRPQRPDPSLGPEAIPTWLDDHVSTLDRTDFTVSVLRYFQTYVDILWQSSQMLLEHYRANCGTLGRRVTVDLGDRQLIGTATDIDSYGHLLLTDDQNSAHIVSAGDVVHLRPQSALPHQTMPNEK